MVDLNAEISNRITLVEDILFGNAPTEGSEEPNPSVRRLLGLSNAGGKATETCKLLSPHLDGKSLEDLPYPDEKIDENMICQASERSSTKSLSSSVPKKVTNSVGSVINTAKGASKLATHAVGSAVNMVAGDKDGQYYSGGFVSFRTLSLKYAALQMLHNDTPFMMSVSEAPDPNDVFWANVGREHKEIQLGELFSRAASVGICLLWTIPMAFFASLSTVEGLKKQFDFVENAIEVFPALEPILQQLAPLLVVVFNSL